MEYPEAMRASGRLLCSFVCCLALALPPGAPAADPPSATIRPKAPAVTWSGEFRAPTMSSCGGAGNPMCDDFILRIIPPKKGTYEVDVVLDPGPADWDLEIYDPSGDLVEVAAGTAPGSSPRAVLVDPRPGEYTIVAMPVAPAPTSPSYTARATMTTAADSPPPPGDACAEGLTILTDAAGDAVFPGWDLRSVQLAQPDFADGEERLVFTINTDPGQSPQPPGSAWYVAMRIPDPAPGTTHYRAVHMVWSGATPVFESYEVNTDYIEAAYDGRYAFPNSYKPAEATSSYDPPFDKVVIVVKATHLGLDPGDTIRGFVAGVQQRGDPVHLGLGPGVLHDMMPDTMAYTGRYEVRASGACRTGKAQ